MSPMRSRIRRGAAAALTVLMAAALGAAGAGASDAEPGVPQQRRIASSVLGADHRITLTALRSAGDGDAASVLLRVYTRSDGVRRESDRVTVGDVDGWFWYPLTGTGAVCRFSTASTEPAPLTVGLLVTPSIGCSDPVHYVVKEGRVYAG
ncbi:hypothetical protein [Streptomyces sp. P9-A2]|uniref:hypothetical protein n=1 Tax=Streptomyces sp. P9-A2 TaxID=3072284 RepID=UPI002FCA2BF9